MAFWYHLAASTQERSLNTNRFIKIKMSFYSAIFSYTRWQLVTKMWCFHEDAKWNNSRRNLGTLWENPLTLVRWRIRLRDTPRDFHGYTLSEDKMTTHKNPQFFWFNCIPLKTKKKAVRLRGEKLNYRSVAKEISKPPFFGSWTPVGIKVYPVNSIHVSFKCFEPCPYLVCHVNHNRKRLKTRTEWIVFEI